MDQTKLAMLWWGNQIVCRCLCSPAAAETTARQESRSTQLGLAEAFRRLGDEARQMTLQVSTRTSQLRYLYVFMQGLVKFQPWIGDVLSLEIFNISLVTPGRCPAPQGAGREAEKSCRAGHICWNATIEMAGNTLGFPSFLRWFSDSWTFVNGHLHPLAQVSCIPIAPGSSRAKSWPLKSWPIWLVYRLQVAFRNDHPAAVSGGEMHDARMASSCKSPSTWSCGYPLCLSFWLWTDLVTVPEGFIVVLVSRSGCSPQMAPRPNFWIVAKTLDGWFWREVDSVIFSKHKKVFGR